MICFMIYAAKLIKYFPIEKEKGGHLLPVS